MAGQGVDVPTTVGAGCFLGVSVVAAADTTTLEAGSGACARAAQALVPDSHPHAICTDGWQATQGACQALFTQITVILCCLHALLTIRDRATTTLGNACAQVQKRGWEAYHAPSKRAFS